ncbi:hypothetical protein [Actinomadura sp. 7K507]|uniref:hypothetical protein n=1 Tax=Actinomadura sp. 7K507 TaxID=2530365 RepID=UPI0010486C35|nr:hypothetical protein [Actinomadura sp. 7K507]TDC83863.1 hypothetical protein E1285_27875 [Actinomadura sp. 7K507]
MTATRGTAWTVGLYSWDVRSGDERRAGPGGISDDRRRALDALAGALRDEPPGAWGTVWSVHLKLGRRPEYDYGGLVALGSHDPQSGAVTVEGP